MKSMRSVFLVIMCLVFAGCGKAPNELLIDSFEGELNNETVDYGASGESSMEVTADTALKVCGEQSLKMKYTLNPGEYMWLARGYNLDVKGAAQWLITPEKIKWSHYDTISLQMYGHKNGGMIALDIKDSGGELWRFILDGKFEGWKEIRCPIAEFFVRNDWQPSTADGNGIMDFPIMSFQFEPRLPGTATYHFDCVKLLNTTENE